MAACHVTGPALLASSAIIGAILAPTAAADPNVTSAFTLSVRETGRPERTVVLTCDPAGGTHPDAIEACESLATADGDFAAIRAQQQSRICTMIYSPVWVEADGAWRGRPVHFQQAYPNRCVATSYTASVFQF